MGRSEGRFGGRKAEGLGNFLLKRAARTGLQGQSDESGENLKCSGERGGGSLGAQHGREGVGRLAAGAGGDYVIDSLLKLLACALQTLQVVPEGTSDRLFDGVRF
jgi:hypothetical protein